MATVARSCADSLPPSPRSTAACLRTPNASGSTRKLSGESAEMCPSKTYRPAPCSLELVPPLPPKERAVLTTSRGESPRRENVDAGKRRRRRRSATLPGFAAAAVGACNPPSSPTVRDLGAGRPAFAVRGDEALRDRELPDPAGVPADCSGCVKPRRRDVTEKRLRDGKNGRRERPIDEKEENGRLDLRRRMAWGLGDEAECAGPVVSFAWSAETRLTAAASESPCRLDVSHLKRGRGNERRERRRRWSLLPSEETPVSPVRDLSAPLGPNSPEPAAG